MALGKTLSQLATEALQVQDACNLLGVSSSFATAVRDLRDALQASGLPCDTGSVRRHPICKLWASKIESLVGGLDDFAAAYSAVCDLSGHGNGQGEEVVHADILA